MSSQSYKEAIAIATKEILHEIPNAVVIGQGVCDPTRIFGTTAGLIEEFGSERIIDMPIMEEGMTGIAIGMALNGLYPIQTHIRVDFLLLAVNQLVNMAAKYRYMYGGAFEVPMLIRAIVGRSWGQGPSIRKAFRLYLLTSGFNGSYAVNSRGCISLLYLCCKNI